MVVGPIFNVIVKLFNIIYFIFRLNCAVLCQTYNNRNFRTVVSVDVEFGICKSFWLYSPHCMGIRFCHPANSTVKGVKG